MGGDVAFNIIHFIFWTILLIILEGGLLSCLRRNCRCKRKITPRSSLDLDEDVIEEEQRIEQYVKSHSGKPMKNLKNTGSDKMPVCVHDFRKVYSLGCTKSHLAVEKASFGVEYGECFALLGVNGAGKTTIFKSLT